MNIDPCSRVTGLAVVHMYSPNRPFNCLVDIGVCKDDILRPIPKLARPSLMISGKSHTGLFPPSSKVTFFRFELADAFKIDLPVTVDPVNAILSICMCCAIAAPTVLPYPLTRLMQPLGKPAFAINSHIFSAVRGVVSADLMTTVLPQANAGAIC